MAVWLFCHIAVFCEAAFFTTTILLQTRPVAVQVSQLGTISTTNISVKHTQTITVWTTIAFSS